MNDPVILGSFVALVVMTGFMVIQIAKRYRKQKDSE